MLVLWCRGNAISEHRTNKHRVCTQLSPAPAAQVPRRLVTTLVVFDPRENMNNLEQFHGSVKICFYGPFGGSMCMGRMGSPWKT